ncbi:MAG: hypothetical protein FD167_1239 [bacterium]|nr:MAG: hypothetical protein FD167_1239 [bacterium]
MVKLIAVEEPDEILLKYRNTPVERLFLYHNLGEKLPSTTVNAQLLVGKCIDHRKDLTIPNEFAYIIRRAGANLHGSEFEISYAIAVGGVSTIALLAHTDCGMSHVTEKRDVFIDGLVERAGCSLEQASEQFDKQAESYHIEDPVEFILNQMAWLQSLYPKVLIAPLLYRVEDDRLVQIVDIA